MTREQLYEMARRAGIEGRSKMGKEQLLLALEEQPAAAPAPARRPATAPPARAAARTPAGRKRSANGGRRPAEKASPPARPRSPVSGRALWKGSINFGLISIPVGLFTATEERDVGFHLLSAADGGRIRYKRVSSVTGEEVPSEQIVRGFEYEKDRYVTFTDEELQRIPSDGLRSVEVVQFARAEEIDPVYFEKPYYVAPEQTGRKAYRVLQRAMEASGKVAVAKVTLRDKERLCALRPAGEVLMLETLRWPDEIRVPAFAALDGAPEGSAREVDLAVQLIEGMTEAFVPERFRDSYRQNLEEAIQARIEGRSVRLAPEARESAVVTDLVAALQRSVAATRMRKSA